MKLRDFPLAQELIREGFAQGFVEAFVESFPEGRVEGTLCATLRVLEKRFGVLPESSLAPLKETVDLALLQQVLDAAVTASSPAEVLAVLPRSG